LRRNTAGCIAVLESLKPITYCARQLDEPIDVCVLHQSPVDFQPPFVGSKHEGCTPSLPRDFVLNGPKTEGAGDFDPKGSDADDFAHFDSFRFSAASLPPTRTTLAETADLARTFSDFF
jgi:hypothetical protein